MDQDTFSVYGHVIGSDRLGHALIIPLCDTIQQVIFAFNAKSVRLPQEAKPASAVDSEAPEGHQRGHQNPRRRRLSHELPEDLTSNAPPYTGHSEVDVGSKHVCAACLAPYRTAHALHEHAKEATHEAYKCTCGTGFIKQSSLKRHIDIKDAPKTFDCTLCYDKFTHKDELKDHCRRDHKVSDKALKFLFSSSEMKTQEEVFQSAVAQ